MRENLIGIDQVNVIGSDNLGLGVGARDSNEAGRPIVRCDSFTCEHIGFSEVSRDGMVSNVVGACRLDGPCDYERKPSTRADYVLGGIVSAVIGRLSGWLGSKM